MVDSVSRRGALWAFAGTASASAAAAAAAPQAPSKASTEDARSVAVGLFADLERTTVPVGTDYIRTSGCIVPGFGAAQYSLDADQTGRRARPWRKKTANGRWFRLAQPFPDVTMFGALGQNAVADTEAALASIEFLDTPYNVIVGGRVFFPRGIWHINKTLVLSNSNAEKLSSMTIEGEGMNNTVLQAVAPFSGKAIIRAEGRAYHAVKNIHLDGGKLGIHGYHDAVGASEVFLERVFTENCEDGFHFADTFMVTMSQCRAKGCSGRQGGFNFAGYHTSLDIRNCYALDNAGHGFNVVNAAYSAFTACGSDNNGGAGYNGANLADNSFIACGAESNALAGFMFSASRAQDAASMVKGTKANLIGCFAFDNDRAGRGFGNVLHSFLRPESTPAGGSTLTITARVYEQAGGVTATPYSVTSGTRGAESAQKGHVIDLSGSTLVRPVQGVAAVRDPVAQLRVDGVVFKAGAAKDLVLLSSVFGHVDHYSGLLQVEASSRAINDPRPAVTASYLLHVVKSPAGAQIATISALGLIAGGDFTHPSFTWSLQGDRLRAKPVGSTANPGPNSFSFTVTKTGTLALQG